MKAQNTHDIQKDYFRYLKIQRRSTKAFGYARIKTVNKSV